MTGEFDVCRERTPEEHRAVERAQMRRLQAYIDQQVREIAEQYMAYVSQFVWKVGR